jgi:hypothetical protein
MTNLPGWHRPTAQLQNRRATSLLPRPVRSPAQSTGLQPCVPVPANKAACKVARDPSILILRGAAPRGTCESEPASQMIKWTLETTFLPPTAIRRTAPRTASGTAYKVAD